MAKLSHVGASGEAKMVDVGDKVTTSRRATASVEVLLNKETFQLVKENRSHKGDILSVATLAGIQAAKQTALLIPLCHQVPLHRVDVQFTLNKEDARILITSQVSADWITGVEMEALTACSVAALAVYDMVKAVQKDVVISDLKLLSKTGGKSGDFKR